MSNKSIPRLLLEAVWRLLTLPIVLPVVMLLGMTDEVEACNRFVKKLWFITENKKEN